MASRITPVQIRFGLDNPSAQPTVVDAMQERLADQIRGDLGRGLSEE